MGVRTIFSLWSKSVSLMQAVKNRQAQTIEIAMDKRLLIRWEYEQVKRQERGYYYYKWFLISKRLKMLLFGNWIFSFL